MLLRSCRHLSTGLKRNVDISHKKKALYEKILRVNHAGELGADRIYAGQLLVLENSSVGPTIKHMWDQEKEHLSTFENLIQKYKTRPSFLTPFWNIAGFSLGVGSAMLGKETAMALTVAVESVISEHYNNQIRELMSEQDSLIDDDDRELLKVITKFRDEEIEHHDTGLQNEAEKSPIYQPLTSVIKAGCKAAIYIAERI